MSVIQYKKNVLMLLADGFELIETSCFTDVLAWANFQDHVDIKLVSASIGNTVKTAFGGFTVTPQAQIKDLNLDSFDGLAIPGGMQWAGFFDDALSDKFKSIIKYFVSENKPIAAVCVASVSLANAGALLGKNATVYHTKGGKHKATLEQMGASFIDKPIVKDGNITTSTGPGTAVEVALSLLSDLTDFETTEITRHTMRIPKPSISWYEPQV
jgi:4-methyl-5(b-hydroxyethyl)-thiazole monophosphate biosynthesis